MNLCGLFFARVDGTVKKILPNVLSTFRLSVRRKVFDEI